MILKQYVLDKCFKHFENMCIWINKCIGQKTVTDTLVKVGESSLDEKTLDDLSWDHFNENPTNNDLTMTSKWLGKEEVGGTYLFNGFTCIGAMDCSFLIMKWTEICLEKDTNLDAEGFGVLWQQSTPTLAKTPGRGGNINWS